MADYCAVTDVQTNMQNFSTFSESTDPSSTEVETFCGQITAEINARMNAVGITTPVTDTEKLKLLKLISLDGVIALVLNSLEMESEEGARRQQRYDAALKRIEKAPAIIEETSEAFVTVGSSGETADRPFKRGEQVW